jgi:hypothetical protein
VQEAFGSSKVVPTLVSNEAKAAFVLQLVDEFHSRELCFDGTPGTILRRKYRRHLTLQRAATLMHL